MEVEDPFIGLEDGPTLPHENHDGTHFVVVLVVFGEAEEVVFEAKY